MEDYKEEYELGSIVTATRTFNRETITGEFGGFHLLDKSNPKSIVGVVHTPNGSYDVELNSIESVISEDERIRKELIEMVKLSCTNGNDVDKKIAWLEKQGKNEEINEASYRTGIKRVLDNPESYGLKKQGEQKSADKVKPKFKVGDWAINGDKIVKITRVDDNCDGNFTYWTFNGTYILEDTWRLWTIKDAKDGDVLATDSWLYLFKYTNNKAIIQFHCNIPINGKQYKWSFLPDECYLDIYINANIHPATKEQRDLLFQKMKEAGYEWDAEKKELKKIETIQSELPKGEDYGIDGLYHAAKILEKTLGEVEGYQSDDGILEHECAIEAVKRLYKQKPIWYEEDEQKPIEWNKRQVVNALTFMLTEKIKPLIKKASDGTISNREEMYMSVLLEIRSFINGPSFQIGKDVSLEWSEEDEMMLNDIIRGLKLAEHLIFACDCQGKTQIASRINWLKFLKGRVQPQPKQDWSEEDEQMFNDIIEAIDKRYAVSDYQEMVTWFKALKERYTWKPSDKQMEALNNVFNDISAGWDDSVIESLYNDLKKLKVE